MNNIDRAASRAVDYMLMDEKHATIKVAICSALIFGVLWFVTR